jgi:2-amino-4-hydroxy-6-hydroxymethyldihydropteridine diphosphokinase
MTDVETAVLMLGANLGRREATLAAACDMIRRRAGEITGLSSLYEGAAWGVPNQPAYLNRAAVIRTSLRPAELLETLQGIEAGLGRRPAGRWMPRHLDIDILFYGDAIIATEKLSVPHPLIAQRRFVLEPLTEIMPQFVHPQLNKTIRSLLRHCPDAGRVSRVVTSDHPVA